MCQQSNLHLVFPKLFCQVNHASDGCWSLQMSTSFKLLLISNALNGVFPTDKIFSAYFINIFQRIIKSSPSTRFHLQEGITYLLVYYKNRPKDFGCWEYKHWPNKTFHLASKDKISNKDSPVFVTAIIFIFITVPLSSRISELHIRYMHFL